MNEVQTKSRGKKFINDLGIYAIGNIGSKLITFLLIPFYTFFITDPADFGYYDICLTVVFILNPFLSFDLAEGGFRFLIETSDKTRHKAIISFVLKAFTRNSIILVGLGLILGYFIHIKYLYYILLFGIIQTAYDVTLQLVRGLGRTKIFVTAGIFNASSIAMLSVLTVAVLGWGVPGIFIANIAARISALLFTEYKVRITRVFFRFKYINKTISKELLHYSLPLIPMVLSWWVLNSNNIFFIRHYLGLDENGIYAILSKFTGILFIIANIFYQTWQQNAVEQYHNPDRDSFFSLIFNNYIYLLCFLVSTFPIALRANYFWLVSSEYDRSADYLFINSVFVMIFALAAFFELGYQCSKQTKRLIPSILAAMVINIVGNYILIPLLGLYGAILSNIITYLFLLVYRIFDTHRYMYLSFNSQNMLYLLFVIISGIYFHLFFSLLTDIVFLIVFSTAFALSAPQSIKKNLRLSRRPK